MSVVLDTWVIIGFLEDSEPAASSMAGLLEEQAPRVSWINIGEVYYVIRRRLGDSSAEMTIRDLQDVVVAEAPTPARVIEASRIKADYPMSYADAFAAATAAAHGSVLWTGDPELLIAGAPWQWRDLR